MSSAKIIKEIRQLIDSIPPAMIDDLRARKAGALADFLKACRPAIDLLPAHKQGGAFLAVQDAAEWLVTHKPRRSIGEYLAGKIWNARAPRKRADESPVGSDDETGKVPGGTYRNRRNKGQAAYPVFYDAPRDADGNYIADVTDSIKDPCAEFIVNTFEEIEDELFDGELLHRDIWNLKKAGVADAKIAQMFGIGVKVVKNIRYKLERRAAELLGDDKPVRWSKARKNKRPRRGGRAA